MRKMYKLFSIFPVAVFFFVGIFLPGWSSVCFSQDPPVIEEVEVSPDIEKNKYFKTDTSHYQVVERGLTDSVRALQRKDPAFWYADSLVVTGLQSPVTDTNRDRSGMAKVREPDKRVSGRSWFQTLLWVLIIGGFVAFLVIYLGNINVRLFRKRAIRITDDGGQDETEDIFTINYQKEIDRAAGQGNHRLAIRLMYLRLLKNLAEKNIIQYKPDRTNLDYLAQLGSTMYYHDFFRITRNYEYAWYGKLDVNEKGYDIIKKDMDRFNRFENN